MFRHRIPFNWARPLRTRPRAQRIPPSTRTQSSTSQASRIDRITSRLPRRLQKYTNGLRNAPVSHVVSFLILHELTAIVPLFALVALFHYTTYVPIAYMTEHFGGYVQGGLARFEKYFKRKGWFGFEKDEKSDVAQSVGGGGGDNQARAENAMEQWRSGDPKYQLLMEVALAYAITKAFLPLRIIGSVWATPWFASVLMRARGVFTRKP